MVTFPRVSVIIPAYNAEVFLTETLQSVLNQDYTNLEIVVIDDGSTDGTYHVAKAILAEKPNIPSRVLFQTNSGVAAARNLGIANARGSYLAFLDSDDIWLRGKLSAQIALITLDPASVGVTTGYQPVSTTGDALGRPLCPKWTSSYVEDWLTLQAPGPLLSSTLLVENRGPLDQLLFDERLSTAADAAYGYRLQRQGRVRAIRKVQVLYRQSSGQMHRNSAAVNFDYEQLMNEPPIRDSTRLRTRIEISLRFRAARDSRDEIGLCRRALSLIPFLVRHPLILARRGLRQAQALWHGVEGSPL